MTSRRNLTVAERIALLERGVKELRSWLVGGTGNPTHSSLSGVTIDQHHARDHSLVGSTHTVSGLTAGHVLQALTASTFGFAQLAHSSLSGAGLGTAGHVTNADAHDHVGGDGAQIDHGGLGGLGDVVDHVGYARGVLSGGYAEVTASQTGLTTTADLTSLSVTVTVGTSRRIKITGYVSDWQRTAGGAIGDRISLDIEEGGTRLSRAFINWETAAGSAFGNFSEVIVYLTPSAGSHTYNLQYSRVGGTATISMRAASGEPAFIAVEDVGPA